MKKFVIRFLVTMFFSIATVGSASATYVLSNGETTGEWQRAPGGNASGGAAAAPTSVAGGVVGKYTSFNWAAVSWGYAYSVWVRVNNPGTDLYAYKHSSTDFYIKRTSDGTSYIVVSFAGKNLAGVNKQQGFVIYLSNANISTVGTWYTVHIETDGKGRYTLAGAQINGSPLVGGELALYGDGASMSDGDVDNFWKDSGGITVSAGHNWNVWDSFGIDEFRMKTLATPAVFVLR